jgi:hypothetical protein
MSDVEKFENMIRDLERKREKCVQRGTELADERANVALSAHTGDNKAGKRLAEIHVALTTQSSELASFDAALKAAAARLVAAQQVETQAANRQRAEEMRKVVAELGECFPYLDRHLTEAARALIAIHDGIAKLHQAGFAFPSESQLRLGLTTVLQSWAHGLPRSLHDQLRDGFEFLAPGRRQTASEYWAAISPSLDNQITQRLGKTESARVREDA